METFKVEDLVSAADQLQPNQQLVNKLKDLLSNMAQNVTTIECLISSMANEQDKREVNEKMAETARKLDELLPLMENYLGLPEPDNPIAKEKWWMQREKMNRELEAFLHNFQLLHAVLGSKLSAIPNTSLAQILRSELKDMEGGQSEFRDEEISNMVSQAEQTLIVIVSEMNDNTIHPDAQEQLKTVEIEETKEEPTLLPKEPTNLIENQTSEEDEPSASSSPKKQEKIRKKRKISNACRQS